jgi:hypothetical protein
MIERTGFYNIGGINYFLDEYQQVTNKKLYAFDTPDFYFPLKNERDFLQAYNNCPPLKAIIGKRAKAFNTGRIYYLNTNTDKPARGKQWLKDLIKKPNALQNEQQFFAQQNHYIDTFGYCPVLKIKAVGFEDQEEVSAIWNIPPWLFDIEYTGKWLHQFKIEGIYKSYMFVWEGKTYELDMKNVYFVFDDGIGTENDCNLTIPDSRLVGMDYVISNIWAAYKSRNTLITKRGAIGILSNKAKEQGVGVPISSEHKKELQQDFASYGLTGQPFQVIITEANLGWQQMAISPRELMLFEETTENIERLCDAYGWPIELIARGKDVTYDNKLQARKDLYQNTLIPESDSRMEQNSVGLGLDVIEIRRDFSNVAVLQEDKKTKADARKAINEYCQTEWDADLMTKNEWRQELGLEPIANHEYDKYKSELGIEPVSEEDEEDDKLVNEILNEEEDEEESTSEDSSTEDQE